MIKQSEIDTINNKINYSIEMKTIENTKTALSLDKLKVVLQMNSAIYNPESMDEIAKNLLWNHIKTCDLNKDSGYFGAAFKNPKNTMVLIVHRGTDFSFSELFQASSYKEIWNALTTDYFADGKILFKTMPSQYNDALNFFLETVKENPECNFLQTGHSLGGFLTQCCHRYSEKFLNIKLVTMVCDSPGALEIFNKQYPDNNSIIKTMPIYFYYTSPNIINTCGTRINPDIPVNKISFLPQESFNPTIKDYMAYSFEIHSITNILKGVNIGKYTIESATEWPTTLTDGFKTFISNQKIWNEFIKDNKVLDEICDKLKIPNNENSFSDFFKFFLNELKNLDSTISAFKKVEEAILKLNNASLEDKSVTAKIFEEVKNIVIKLDSTIDNINFESVISITKNIEEVLVKSNILLEPISDLLIEMIQNDITLEKIAKSYIDSKTIQSSSHGVFSWLYDKIFGNFVEFGLKGYKYLNPDKPLIMENKETEDLDYEFINPMQKHNENIVDLMGESIQDLNFNGN